MKFDDEMIHIYMLDSGKLQFFRDKTIRNLPQHFHVIGLKTKTYHENLSICLQLLLSNTGSANLPKSLFIELVH